MSFVAVAIGGAAVIGAGGAYIASQGTKDAANTQAAAANQATSTQYDEFQRQEAMQQPWLDAGKSALPQLQGMASQKPEFTQQDFLNNQDPAYQFDLQQGQQAIERSAAARGGLQSGGTLKDLTSYSQGMASNEYQSAYSRFMNNQNTQFNRLASIAGIGQTASGAIGAAGTNMANNVGNIAMSNANAQGAASMAGSQIWGNTLSSLGNQGANYALQNQAMNNQQNFQQQLLSNLGGGYSAGGGLSYPSAGASAPNLGIDYSGFTAGM